MKNLLLLITISALSSSLFSQGNLQFNQVLTYGGTSIASPNWTVPAGKVWKIETVNMFNFTGSSTFIVNNNTVLFNMNSTLPIWLKPGDNCKFSMTSNINPWFVSIIEFNIIP